MQLISRFCSTTFCIGLFLSSQNIQATTTVKPKVKSQKVSLSRVYSSQLDQAGQLVVKNYERLTLPLYYAQTQFFSKKASNTVKLKVNPDNKKHSIWGFGGSVTESCLSNLDEQSPQNRKKVMDLLFDKKKGAGLSFLRVSLGANDFSKRDYTLNDLPAGETDIELNKMTLSDLDPSISFVKEAQKYDSNLTVMVTPWTPPPWMKDTQAFKGGQLKKEYFPTYAEYLRRSMNYLETRGLKVSYLTAMNEPLIGEAQTWWYFPQGYMSIEDQFDFSMNHLLPLLKKYAVGNNDHPRLLLHDHNWGNNEDTVKRFAEVLKEKQTGIAGVAMHCYGGDFSVQENFHRQYPGVNSLNSECTANLYSKTPKFDFQWWLQNQVVDSTQIGSTGALGWNLCLDEKGGPRNNGCANCRGLVTINKQSKKLEVNAEYYAIAQVSRYLKKGAVVVEHEFADQSPLRGLTFINPDNSLVVVIRNPSAEKYKVELQIQGSINEKKNPMLTVPAEGAITFVF